MKKKLKRLMSSVAPEWTTSYLSARARAHSHRVIERWGCHRINDALFARFGDRVLGGPFRGLALSPMTKAEQIGPYLLGLYESELHPAWEAVLRGRFDMIVDIGAKFGYYAVGLARRYPASRVVAFDTDRWARQVMKEMVRDNGVLNVETRGYCAPRWLSENLIGGSLVISDCEGFEGELFCSQPIPNLASATLIIETHDAWVPGTSQRLRAHLGSTHDLTEFPSNPEPRTAPVDLDLSGLDERGRYLATQEVRPPQLWLLGLPRAGTNQILKNIQDLPG